MKYKIRITEDWRRINMSKDELSASYENICALSNDLFDRGFQAGNIPINILNSIQHTITGGLIEIREKYKGRKTERVYHEIFRIGEELLHSIDCQLTARIIMGDSS